EAKFLADQGATLILGHDPHVLQPVKEVSGKDGNKALVWYSLGNFLNTQLETEALFNGLAVMDIDRNSKQITSVGYLPIASMYEWSPDEAKDEDLLARTNVKLHALDDVTDEMVTANQLDTTVEAQRSRLSDTVNMFTSVRIFSKEQYLD